VPVRAGSATREADVEVAPGIHRIESILGPRPFSQYLLRGERTLLVDTGVKGTPGEVILPYFAEIGFDPAELDFVLNSHADVDHFGGNSAIRAACPGALICAHRADVPWIESRELIMRERYGWYEQYGIPYPDEVFAWLRGAMGPEVPVDVRLSGDEELRLGPELAVRILHLPGHSAGHLGVWEPHSRTAIVLDAVMALGLLDTDGNVIHPPPVPHVTEYEQSVRLLQSLEPARLLTAHYAVMEGDEVGSFLAESLAFIESTRAAVSRALAEEPEITLAALLARTDPELGPFTSMPNELAATLRGVLLERGLEAR
jgi:glyoxylase-like metal-dependent hydrolase (beta-lactamase superfamily II)